ncbi:MAG: VWA domain-containing protein [Cellvibrionaceae bacterium]
MKPMSYLSVLSTAVLLSACGGGSSGGDDANTGNPTTERTAAGSLVVPETTVARNERVLRSPLELMRACPDVPAGYRSLDSASVEFLDSTGAVLSTTTTGSCGEFSATVSDDVVSVRATSTSYRDLVTDVTVFTGGVPGVASTISSTANYEIASIQLSGANGDTVAFSVTDSETNTAVIGIPQDAFAIDINANPAPIVDVSTASQTAEPASVALVLDASGSMSASVSDENGDLLLDPNGIVYTRNRISSLAAHTYLDSMPTTDETAMVLFGSDVHFIDDTKIADSLSLTDENGGSASYTFSTDGYTGNAEDLRFIVDAYNRSSQLYSSFNVDPRHPETPNLNITNGYSFGGGTSLYDAIESGLVNTDSRSANRKIVIAMSDGQNNSSLLTEDQVIASAVAKAIPVYTIAFGAGDPVAMENIALGTNASFYQIEDADLAGIFQTIQTGIIFQYLASYNGTANFGDTLTVTLNYNGLSTTRDLTI